MSKSNVHWVVFNHKRDCSSNPVSVLVQALKCALGDDIAGNDHVTEVGDFDCAAPQDSYAETIFAYKEGKIYLSANKVLDNDGRTLMALVHHNESVCEGFGRWVSGHENRFAIFCSSEIDYAASKSLPKAKAGSGDDSFAKTRLFALNRPLQEFKDLIPRFIEAVAEGPAQFKQFLERGEIAGVSVKKKTLPASVIAAYLLQKAELLEKYPRIKAAADTESDGQYEQVINAYFRAGPDPLVNLAAYGVLSLSLRSKVSHSWLDHEILNTGNAEVVRRYQAGEWTGIRARWKTLHELALRFGAELDQLDALTLVDSLAPLKELPCSQKTQLEKRLQTLIEQSRATTEPVGTTYRRCLDELWAAAEPFFDSAANPGSDRDTLVARWEQVRTKAAALKALFQNGAVPDAHTPP